ncbi:MAG: hypothetical protein QXU40_02045 [Candidatus Pacearchaeota archaeon]
MNRDYSVSLLGYIVYGTLCIFGMFFLTPVLISLSLEEIRTGIFFKLPIYKIIGSMFIIFFGISLLFTDTFLAVILAPFTSYWRIGLREGGIYGCRFWEWERITKRNLRKLCNWENVEKIKWLGLFDMAAQRVRVTLRNGKRFHITNIGHSPWETLKFLTTKDERERVLKYSNIMMYALIMKKIGRDKFEGFEKGRINTREEKRLIRVIEYVLETEVDKIIEEDKKKAEELGKAKEEKGE